MKININWLQSRVRPEAKTKQRVKDRIDASARLEDDWQEGEDRKRQWTHHVRDSIRYRVRMRAVWADHRSLLDVDLRAQAKGQVGREGEA
jgi:hypothetical protein